MVWVGGIATIVSILGIFLYLLWEVFPLFRSASGTQDVALSVRHEGPMPIATTLIGMDEYREVVYVLDGKLLQFIRMPQGDGVDEVGGELAIPGMVQSSVLVGQKGNLLSVATRDGLVFPVEVGIRPVFKDRIRSMVPHVKVGASIRVLPEGKTLEGHAHTRKDERQTIAALATDGTLWLTTVEEPGEFAFSDELTEFLGENAAGLIQNKDKKVVELLLSEQGLNYGNLPKALLTFHKYKDGTTAKAIDEHLVEGSLYCSGSNNSVHIHFTVSEEHIEPIKLHLAKSVPALEKRFGKQYDISFSIQDKVTDTIAVDLDNQPFRQENGELLFRPGGHGALLTNLDAIDADIVFIKNIDTF